MAPRPSTLLSRWAAVTEPQEWTLGHEICVNLSYDDGRQEHCTLPWMHSTVLVCRPI